MTSVPAMVWQNTAVWTCETCTMQYTTAFNGRLRHFCRPCGLAFVEQALPVWYSATQQEELGQQSICETVDGTLVRCTGMGTRPNFDDAEEMGRLFLHHETLENGAEPTPLSKRALPLLPVVN